MKITIEHEGITVSVEDENVVDIFQTKELLQRVLVGTGFHPDTVEEIFVEE